MPRILTKTERCILYTFKELCAIEKRELTVDAAIAPHKKAVDTAREWLREGAADYEWWDCTYDMWKQALEQIGFRDANLQFSGFSSQGDGASFDCKYVDLAPLVEFFTTPRQKSNCVTVSKDANGKAIEEFRPWLLEKLGWNEMKCTPAYKRLLVADGDINCRVERNSHHYSHSRTCSFYADLQRGGTYKRFEALLKEFEAEAESLRDDLSDALYKSLEEEYEYLTGDESLGEMADGNDWFFDQFGHKQDIEDFDLPEGKKKKPKKKVTPSRRSLIGRLQGTRRLLRE